MASRRTLRRRRRITHGTWVQCDVAGIVILLWLQDACLCIAATYRCMHGMHRAMCLVLLSQFLCGGGDSFVKFFSVKNTSGMRAVPLYIWCYRSGAACNVRCLDL